MTAGIFLPLLKKNHRRTRCLNIAEKSLIQHCERSELRLHFEWTKLKIQFGEFSKT